MLFNQRDLPSSTFAAEIDRLAALIVDMEQLQRGVLPEELSNADAPVLDRWELSKRSVPCLIGLSTGHPKLVGENRLVRTSDLWLLSESGMGTNVFAMVPAG
jgi:hypothetical protein